MLCFPCSDVVARVPVKNCFVGICVLGRRLVFRSNVRLGHFSFVVHARITLLRCTGGSFDIGDESSGFFANATGHVEPAAALSMQGFSTRRAVLVTLSV